MEKEEGYFQQQTIVCALEYHQAVSHVLLLYRREVGKERGMATCELLASRQTGRELGVSQLTVVHASQLRHGGYLITGEGGGRGWLDA